MQRTKQNHAWRVFRLLLIFFCIGLSLQFTSCGKKQAENTVFSVDDLSGKKIGVQLGTTGDTLVSDYETDGSNTTVERFNKGNDAIQALKQGKIDAVVIDAQPAQSFVAANSDLMILPEEFANEDYAIAIAKGNSSLTSSINDALNTLKANGTLDAILNNYIGENIGQTPYTSPENVNRSNGTLVMATNAYFQPYEYYDGDAIVGIDVEVAQAIADKLGMELEVTDIAFDSIIPGIQAGRYDAGVAGISITADRLKNCDFSDPYFLANQVIVVNPGSAIQSKADLTGKTIAVQTGTTAETYLTKEYPDIPLQKYDSYATAKNALENGNGVAWANDNTEVIAFAKQNSGYTVGIPSLGSQDTIAPAVSKGNTTLLDWINDEIKSLGEESFFHKDYEETLVDTYGLDYEDELVVEGGETNA